MSSAPVTIPTENATSRTQSDTTGRTLASTQNIDAIGARNVAAEMTNPPQRAVEQKVSHTNSLFVNTQGRLAIGPDPLTPLRYVPSFLNLGYAAFTLYESMSTKKQFRSLLPRMSELEFVTVVFYLAILRYFKAVKDNDQVPRSIRHAIEALTELNLDSWKVPDVFLPWFNAIGKVQVPGTNFSMIPRLPTYTVPPEGEGNYGIANADTASFLPNFYALIVAINRQLFDGLNVDWNHRFSNPAPAPTPAPAVPVQIDQQYHRLPGLTHTPDRPVNARRQRVGFARTPPPVRTTDWLEYLCIQPNMFGVWAHSWKTITDHMKCTLTVKDMGVVASQASLIRASILPDVAVQLDGENRFSLSVASRDEITGEDYGTAVTFSPHLVLNENSAFGGNANHGTLGQTTDERYFVEEYFHDGPYPVTQTMHQYTAISEV